MNAPITFNPRWREELVATSAEGTLIFEITMGTLHVYFPDEVCWRAAAPEWAREQWARYREACEHWCGNNRIPFSLVDNALMYGER